MKKKTERLFITTTNSVDNGKAIDYHGIVSSHIVSGTGFITDYLASLSDFWGSRSGAYRKQIEKLYDQALDEISEKAKNLGANAVVGVKIDINNIAAKGMSMFMITAVGTAATIVFDGQTSLERTDEQ